MMEMDMRQFDPAIRRFSTIDPVTHFHYSPYQGFDNNPTYWTDPSGADAVEGEIVGADGLTNSQWLFLSSKSQEINAWNQSKATGEKEIDKNNTKDPCTDCPAKIDLSQDTETIVESIISWARYIKANNEAQIYLRDMLKIASVLGEEKFYHMIFRFVDPEAAIINPHKGEYNDETVFVGYNSSYYNAAQNEYTRVTGVDTYHKDKWGKDKYRFAIKIHSKREGSTLPTMIYLHTYDKKTRNLIRERINKKEESVLEGQTNKLHIPAKEKKN